MSNDEKENIVIRCLDCREYPILRVVDVDCDETEYWAQLECPLCKKQVTLDVKSSPLFTKVEENNAPSR